MNREAVLVALEKMRQLSKQRRFQQSVEMMVNFKFLDYKKPENQLDLRVRLPNPTKKSSAKTLLFAKTPEFAAMLEGKVDKIIMDADIQSLSKKDVAEIINDFDLLLAEGQAMLTVGRHLGQQLAPRGRMPKPVQPTMASVEDSLREIGGAIRVTNKKGKAMPLVQVLVGDEKMSNEQLAENVLAVLVEVGNALPNKQQNIRSVFLKETMGPAVRMGG